MGTKDSDEDRDGNRGEDRAPARVTLIDRIQKRRRRREQRR